MIVKTYKLFGNPINGLYAYCKNDKQYYCLYLLINVDTLAQLNGFIDKLGFPWNVTQDDYSKGDFDMLLWQINEMRISLLRNFDGQKLLIITNGPIECNTASWE